MKRKKLNVVVACETSGTVREAFRAKGHNAVSVDLLPHDSGRTKYHYVEDVISFLTRTKGKWDLMIAHPPCTYLCNSGVGWLFRNPNRNTFISRFTVLATGVPGTITRCANPTRVQAMREAIALFNELLNWNDIPYRVIENPIQHGYARYFIPRQNQVVQPWMFGHTESKATCLWLRGGLPNLKETANVKAAWRALPPSQRNRLNWLPPSPLRWKLRSKTFDGIALALADQMSAYILNT